MDFVKRDFEMSLTYFIFNGFQANPEYYECPDDVALRPPSVKRQFWGAYLFVSGVSILILYLVCFVAIATHDLMKTPVYKSMFALGIYDMSSLLVNSIATGIMAFLGISFCEYPALNIILGCIGYGSWLGCCIVSFTLAVMRVSEVGDSSISKIFDGRKINYWLGSFALYGFYGTLLTKPIIFSPALMTWFFDPWIGKDPKSYTSIVHSANNVFLVIGTCVLYFCLAYLFVKKSNTIGVNQISKYQIRVLLQAFFFCIFHLISALIYVLVNNIAAPEFLMIVGHITWQAGTGSVCIVYLTLNRSVRNAVLKMMQSKKIIKVNPINSITLQ